MMSSSLAIFILTLYILIAIWMFWLIYNGIVNLKLIADRKSISLKLQDHTIQQPAEILDTVEEVTLEKVSDHGILHHSNHKTLANHFERINTLVLSESLYRNEDLSIDDIAKRMDMSPGYVSKIIKKTANKNFPIWINEFRVEEVKAMFLDKDFDHYTTLSIGLEAGFKSKSAFYAAFKKITGETPAKFRRKKS